MRSTEDTALAHAITPAADNRAPAPFDLDVDDPANAELVALLGRDVPAIRVIDLYDEVDSFIASVQEQLAPAIARRRELRAVLDAKMRDAQAEIVVHGELRAIMKPGAKETDKRVDVLRTLRELKNEDGELVVPAADLDKAIWLHTPDPQWKTHLTYLRGLAKYGERVKAILDEGLVEVQGQSVLVVERVLAAPKNVTAFAPKAAT